MHLILRLMGLARPVSLDTPECHRPGQQPASRPGTSLHAVPGPVHPDVCGQRTFLRPSRQSPVQRRVLAEGLGRGEEPAWGRDDDMRSGQAESRPWGHSVLRMSVLVFPPVHTADRHVRLQRHEKSAHPRGCQVRIPLLCGSLGGMRGVMGSKGLPL